MLNIFFLQCQTQTHPHPNTPTHTHTHPHTYLHTCWLRFFFCLLGLTYSFLSFCSGSEWPFPLNTFLSTISQSINTHSWVEGGAWLRFFFCLLGLTYSFLSFCSGSELPLLHHSLEWFSIFLKSTNQHSYSWMEDGAWLRLFFCLLGYSFLFIYLFIYLFIFLFAQAMNCLCSTIPLNTFQYSISHSINTRTHGWRMGRWLGLTFPSVFYPLSFCLGGEWPLLLHSLDYFSIFHKSINQHTCIWVEDEA